MKRINTGVCITESLCCTPETNTTLLINYTPIENKNLQKTLLSKKKKKTYVCVCVYIYIYN